MATLVKADWLFLLTDVAHLYTANPSTHPSAHPIVEVQDIDARNVSTLRWPSAGLFIILLSHPRAVLLVKG